MRRRRFSHLVDDFLALRCTLGFDVGRHRWLLRDFARFTDRIGYHGPLTADLALRWAMSPCPGEPGRAERRLSVLRQFARHLSSLDPATEIPPVGLLRRATRRRQPHIYSDAEISALLQACSRLHPREGLRPSTYRTLFSLLASTGLRLSEACRLQRRDVDLREGLLTVRKGKFGKSRLVPLHPTAVEALTRYARRRDASPIAPRSESFFRTERAPALTRQAVEGAFITVRAGLGWATAGRAGRPRIHDLRHTFVVRRLLRWYQEGADVNRKILALATYLGHAKVTDTYWYLSAVPELMAITARRFEYFAQRQQGGVS